MSRITEAEVGVAVLSILAAQPYGRATVRLLKQELPKHVKLSTEDHTDSLTRTNEEIWEQQVRNLKSHSATPGNIFHDGYVTQYTRGIWEITDAGKRRITRSAVA